MGPKLYWLGQIGEGRIAIASRPRGGDWLADEMNGLRRQQVHVLVSLLTSAENHELGLKDEGNLAKAEGLRYCSFPIEDRGVPSLEKAEHLISELRSEVEQGKNVAIHCRQGIGRSSLISAALLVASGEDLKHALNTIARSRGVEVPETAQQREWLNQFALAHTNHLARNSR